MLEIPLLYKDRRLEGETTLRQCQLVQLHLLYVFDAICKAHNLTYFLGGGTLLGAMRHGGFIPWDDDLDVGMPMEDYKKFITIAQTELPKDVVLQTPESRPHTAMPFVKLRDAYSFYYEMRPDITTSDFAGIYMDVFAYEEFPDVNEKLQRWLLLRIAKNYWKAFGHLWGMVRKRRHFWTRLPYYVWCKMAHKCLRVVVEVLKKITATQSVFIQVENNFHFRFDKAKIYPTRMMRFEDGEFPIPNDPEAFLTTQYGNWKEIPPPEKRPRHATIILPTTAQNSPEAMTYPLG